MRCEVVVGFLRLLLAYTRQHRQQRWLQDMYKLSRDTRYHGVRDITTLKNNEIPGVGDMRRNEILRCQRYHEVRDTAKYEIPRSTKYDEERDTAKYDISRSLKYREL